MADPNRASRGFDVRIEGLNQKSQFRVSRIEYLKQCKGDERFVLLPECRGREVTGRVLVCFANGADLGHLPADPGTTICDAILSGAIYVGGFINTGGAAGAWLHFDRVFPSPDRTESAKEEDAQSTLWAIKSMSTMPHLWAWQRAAEAGIVGPNKPKMARTASGSSRGCVSTGIWAVFFTLLGFVGLMVLVAWATNP